MQGQLKIAMESFNRLYGKTTKTVPFNPRWVKNTLSIEGAVKDPDFRLSLPHGAVLKTVDALGRRVLFIGTEYGLIAVNECYTATGDPYKPLHYVITSALAGIWEAYERKHLPVSDYAHASNVPDFFAIEFLQRIAEIAQSERQFGREPSDGMRRYITKHSKSIKRTVAAPAAPQQKPKKKVRPPKHVPIVKALLECETELA